MKTYVRVPDTEVSFEHAGPTYESPVRVVLSEEWTVSVSARSTHSRPEATISVPDDPAAGMEAFAYLGSSIKGFSPERSWPTLRGASAANRQECDRRPETGLNAGCRLVR